MSVAKKIVLSVGFLVVMFGAYGFYANQSSSVLNNNTISVFSWAHVLNVGGQVQALTADGREYELMRITAPNEAERARAAGLISELTPQHSGGDEPRRCLDGRGTARGGDGQGERHCNG